MALLLADAEQMIGSMSPAIPSLFPAKSVRATGPPAPGLRRSHNSSMLWWVLSENENVAMIAGVDGGRDLRQPTKRFGLYTTMADRRRSRAPYWTRR